MGRVFAELLSDDTRVFACSVCHTHLARHDKARDRNALTRADQACERHLLSRDYHALSGDAYLFAGVSNVRFGAFLLRQMTTGPHLACDISCTGCGVAVGWYYQEAMSKSQARKRAVARPRLTRRSYCRSLRRPSSSLSWPASSTAGTARRFDEELLGAGSS